jgi:spermidine dehydrogenase
MRKSDKNLGMDRLITRRDFVNGAGSLGAAVVLTGALTGCGKTVTQNSGVYPPAYTGMRGNHDGAFDVAHALGREGQTNWGNVLDSDEEFDLIVVGGGISGLSAAHFFRKDNPDARILILDNHDDFGGHAKRNEFEVNGKTIIAHGGSQSLVEPSSYSQTVKDLLTDLGVDINRFETAYDRNFYQQHGLKAGIHFNKESWGVDRIVPLSIGAFSSYLPFLATSSESLEEAVSQMPISEGAKSEFLSLLKTNEDQLSEISADEKIGYLSNISYREFLIKHLTITEQEVFDVLQDLAVDDSLGIEAISAYRAMGHNGLPGWTAAGLPQDDGTYGSYVHHFPDGNASIARLLVRSMIPSVALGNTMEDIVTAQFDYSKLDQAVSPVKVRLNSTVMLVKHEGDAQSAESVWVSYVQNQKTYRVKASACVLACNNSIIPYLCPELPTQQKEALSNQVKQPMLFTNVLLRNWRPWKKLGIGAVNSPGSYHTWAHIDFPVSLGDYNFSTDPDEPVIVRLDRYPHVNNQGLTPKEQFRMSRYELLSTSFEEIERETREYLASILSEGGFNPKTDILGITVNRWAHGYAYDYNSLFDTVYDNYDDQRLPHMLARKPFGRITIANADSGAVAMLEVAVEQAYRAVNELRNI